MCSASLLIWGISLVSGFVFPFEVLGHTGGVTGETMHAGLTPLGGLPTVLAEPTLGSSLWALDCSYGT